MADGGKVEVDEGVYVYVAVKDNVRVDVEVLVEVHDAVTNRPKMPHSTRLERVDQNKRSAPHRSTSTITATMATDIR